MGMLYSVTDLEVQAQSIFHVKTALGPVIGVDLIGGLVGVNTFQIVKSFAAAPVAGVNTVGGLVGSDGETHTGTTTRSYWNVNVSEQAASAGGTGLTTAQAYLEASYVEWDFLNVWHICEYRPYPRLQWQGPLDIFCSEVVWYVDDQTDPNETGTELHPFDTIQEGIDAADNGDVVVVLDGEYLGLGNRDITFNGKAITVKSQNGPTGCRIDCQGTGRGFIFENGETSDSTLEGFTIRGGNPSPPAKGGAIAIVSSNPTIRNCVIQDNMAACAAGLDVTSSNVTLGQITVMANSATTGINSGFSQSLLTLHDSLRFESGRFDVYGGEISGPGSLNLADSTLLNIKNNTVCESEIVTSITGARFDAGRIFTDNQWAVIEAVFNQAFVAGANSLWIISPDFDPDSAIITWTGNFMTSLDTSGGLAEAAFAEGGQLSVTGRIYDAPGATLLHDGLILRAQVGEFRVREVSGSTHQLEFMDEVDIVPLGGFLVSSGQLVMSGVQRLSVTLAQTANPHNQFGSDIHTAGPSQISMQISQPPQGETLLTSDISGLGRIEIDAGAQLTLAGEATIDLSDGVTPQGEVVVDGKLVVTEMATVKRTNIIVQNAGASFGGGSDIRHNDITMVQAFGVGGEFFVDGTTTIAHNNITSDGDRYLDLDPDPDSPEEPNITQNHITVFINDGVAGSQGALLELRAFDYDCNTETNPFCESGAFQVSDSPGFTADPSENWVIDALEILSNAKVNLTNRPGFVFQPNAPYPETIYVRKLVLNENAVLNTALQTLYYERLILKDNQGGEIEWTDPNNIPEIFLNGSRIVDEPLLGFSLINIAMDNDTEFDVRVQTRLRNPVDVQPLPPAAAREGSILRLSGNPDIPPGAQGVMEMATKSPGKDSASSVSAKGTFARAGDENITVEFEYLFLPPSAQDAELIVYMSDSPRVAENLVELARIRPPAPGRAGAIGSGRFGRFSGVFPRGNLNFKRGTYIELELRGTNARCFIDNWDPVVICAGMCGNFTDDVEITNLDFLVLLAEFGLKSPDVDKRCLDMVRDLVIDMNDLYFWDYGNQEGLNTCPIEILAQNRMSNTPETLPQPDNSLGVSLPSHPLVIYGKPLDTQLQEGLIYRTDFDGDTSSPAQSSPCPGTDCSLGAGRLLTDSNHRLYQLHGKYGLLDAATGDVIIAPTRNIDYQGHSYVSIGVIDSLDDQISLNDAVFDPDDPGVIYVVPVMVEPTGIGCPYQAAAKLRIQNNGTFDLLEIYGKNPALDTDQRVFITDCNSVASVIYEPDVQHLREIEIDDSNSLYVLSAQGPENNWLLVYDKELGTPSEKRLLLSDHNTSDPNLVGPTAMVVSSHTNRLYLSASVDPQPDLISKIHKYIIDTSDPLDLNVIYEADIDILFPDPNLTVCGPPSSLCEEGQVVTAITSMAENPFNGALYVTGYSAPKFAENANFNEIALPQQLFTRPTLAVVPSCNVRTIDAAPIRPADGIQSLALPYAIAWSGEGLHYNGLRGDLTGDCTIGLPDLALLAGIWLQNLDAHDIAPKPADGIINLVDFALLSRAWLIYYQ